MSFNVDDPLAGILSDGSDDSFFDDDILGKKKPQKKTETPIAAKKNALFNLEETKTQGSNIIDEKILTSDKNHTLKKEHSFDLINKDDSQKTISSINLKQSTSNEPVHQQIESKSKLSSDRIETSKSPAKSKVNTSNIDKANFNELSGNVKKEPKKSLDKAKSSQSLLDDILGAPSTKVISQHTTARKQNFDLDSFLSNADTKTNLASTKSNKQISSSKMENSKEVPNQQKKSKSNDDWLGIFKDKENIDEEEENVPAWLGGGTIKKSKNTKEFAQEHPESSKEDAKELEKPKENAEEPKLQKDAGEEIKRDKVLLRNSETLNMPTLDSKEDLTMEGAALYLQQQESQLMVALQLKAQDEKLAAMQMRQKESQRVQREAAVAQHEQLDSMLRRQTENRIQMQSIIGAHQERITQRIKALLGDANTEDETTGLVTDYQEAERKETPFTKERKQLLQLVQSLQENHDKEIDLMETSYRRQLAFLEVSFTQTEERMKEDSDKLIKFYTEKISWLNDHHLQYKKMVDENLNSLMKRHKAENEMLRDQHLDNVKVLQEHHAALMENVKNAVKQEQILIKDSVGFASDLQQLLSNVKEGNEKCAILYDKVELFSQNTQKDVERSVHIRETQITDMLEQFKNDKLNFEKEKSETKDMIRMLEARLKQMTATIEEESAALRQKKMDFEFEKATFNKQTEFAKNILKKQDEEIKILKDDIQKEYQEKKARIEEERAKAHKDSALIAKEKASVQSLKLELEKTKAELQAHLDEMAKERSKLNAEKQKLHIDEQRAMSKSRDFDLLAKPAMEKQSQADKKYSEAEFLQKKFEDRIRRIQDHVISLNSREKQIAKEKVALSRERLSLHNERKELEGRQCSLCSNTQLNTNSFYHYTPAQVQYPVSRDYRGYSRGFMTPMNNVVEENTIDNVEKEISHLMGAMVDKKDLQNVGQWVQESTGFKDYMDPKFMMLRLDVQQVISNLDHTRSEVETNERQE